MPRISTPQGRIIADVEVLNVGDRLLLDVHLDVRAMLVDRFRELVFTEDVQIEDWTDTWTGLPWLARWLSLRCGSPSELFWGWKGPCPRLWPITSVWPLHPQVAHSSLLGQTHSVDAAWTCGSSRRRRRHLERRCSVQGCTEIGRRERRGCSD